MQRLQELVALQEQKKKLFDALESTTQKMLAHPEEELPLLMAERQSLIEQIDCTAQAMAACQSEEPAFFEAASNHCSREGLSLPLQQVYDQGLEIRSAAGRTKELALQVTLRMESCRDQILEKIKAVNSGAMAQASKYHQPMDRVSSFQSQG